MFSISLPFLSTCILVIALPLYTFFIGHFGTTMQMIMRIIGHISRIKITTPTIVPTNTFLLTAMKVVKDHHKHKETRPPPYQLFLSRLTFSLKADYNWFISSVTTVINPIANIIHASTETISTLTFTLSTV